MNLAGCKRGDLVEIEGDPVSTWVVTDREGGWLFVRLRRGGPARRVSSRQIVGWWRKVSGRKVDR